MKSISLKLPSEVSAELDRACRQGGQTKSEIVRAALDNYLSRVRKGRQPASALQLAGDLAGSSTGPRDLSTKRKYMEDYGR